MAYDTKKRAATQNRYYLKNKEILRKKRIERDLKDWSYTSSQRRKHHLNKYGLTPESYEQMLNSQGRKCAICSTEFSEKKKAVIDHNHKTGKTRGALCVRCNVRLGYLEMDEKTEKLLKYLTSYK